VIKRKGIALISVILIGALVFVSIIGVFLKVVPERNISVARTSSERALSAAEAVISQSSFDLRNTNIKDNVIEPQGMTHYLTVDIARSIAKLGVGTPIDAGELEYSTNPYTTYRVKFKKLPKGDIDMWDPGDPLSDDGDKLVYVAVYALGTVYRGISTSSEVAARKVIRTEMVILYHKESKYTSGENSDVFDYGLFSGIDIAFNGNAQSVDGDIFADGNIDLGNSLSKTRVVNGSASAAGAITGNGKVDLGKNPGVDPIEFPILNIPYYKALADNFKTGQAPYDGVPVYDKDGHLVPYPNTTNPFINPAIRSYLGAPGTSSTVSGIQDFYTNLMAGTGEFSLAYAKAPDALKNLQDNVKATVYYLQGDAHINGQFTCEGTLVIDGNLIINGGAEINNLGGLAFLVNGNIDRANGNATLRGLFYATGGITGNGTFDCYGSIVTKDSVDLNGTFNIYYEPVINMPNLDIEGKTEIVASNITEVEESPSTWEEISIDVFNSAS